MMRLTTFFKTLFALSLVFLFGLAQPVKANSQREELLTSQQLATIIKRGELRVGVKQDVPNFGYRDPKTQAYTGLEVDLAKKIAEQLEVKVVFTPVTAQTRGALLDNGQLDMVIATFTITEERKKLYNFTTPYYTDANSFLVKKTSPIKTWKDLDGKTIGVTQGSIQQQVLTKLAAEKGIHLKFTELGSNPEVAISLAAQRVDAFSIDRSILSGFVGKKNQILDLDYNPSQYGIVTKKSNTDLHAYLDSWVTEWLADGSLDRLYQQNTLKPTTLATN